MSCHSHSHAPLAHHSHAPLAHQRNGGAREFLTAMLLGLALMATLTTSWWYAMR